jgi:hypothetical protein
MIDLLHTLYSDDTFRFTLWHIAGTLHLDGLLAWGIDLAGYRLWEDMSLSPKP